MGTIEKVAIFFGIVGFVGTLISWATDNRTAFTVTIVTLILSLVIYIVIKLIRRLRNYLSLMSEIPNLIEKIEDIQNNSSLLEQHIDDLRNQFYAMNSVVSNMSSGEEQLDLAEEVTETDSQELEILRPITSDKWISSQERNHLSIESNFLTWDECTILLWVHIPGMGEGLRDAPKNKYLIAHQTGEGDNSRHFNAFFLRYSSNNTWDMVFSNPIGDTLPDLDKFQMDDGLVEGWHHIFIAWNNLLPIFKILIDTGSSNSAISKSHLNYWPRNYDDRVFIGAWVSPYPESYCDTKLMQLWICKKYLEPSDSIVQDHLSLHP